MLDRAELWLINQFFGPNMIKCINNVEFVRSELKRRVFEDIRHIVKIAKLKPPIDLKKIAKLRKVLDIVDDPGLISREACLIPINGGFLIKLNPRVPEFKKRSNCAHEIGHTYFYDLNINPPKKSFLSSRYWVEEGYVWEIAREIMAPEPYLFDFVSKNKFSLSINALVNISRYFKISYGLLGERLLHDAHSINREYWDGNALEGIIVVSVSPKDSTACISKKIKVEIYRSPKYKHRLIDVTSKKLEKTFENKDNITETVEEITRLISDGFISNTGDIQKKTLLKDKYCIEVGKVDERCVLSVICEI